MISLFFYFSLSGSAQEAIDLIAQASCECIQDLDDVSDIAAATETCVQQAIFSNLAPILEEFDFDLADEEAATRIGEKIGTEVGLKLVSECPAFMEIMMNSDELDDGFEDYEEAPVDNSENLTGTFLGEKLTKGGFSYLIIEDEYGDKSEFLWLNPFSGDELVNKDLEGKKISLRWKPEYIRNGKDGEYIKTRVISGLTN